MNLLFFTSDYKIGLSSLLTDQLIAINKLDKISVIGIFGEQEQEKGLRAKLANDKVSFKVIEGLDQHSNFFGLVNKISKIISEEDIPIVHVQNNWQLAIISYIKYLKWKRLNFKIIYTLHGFRHNHPVKMQLARVFIGSSLFFLTNRIIYMSDYVMNNFRLLSFKMEKIYLGIDDTFFLKMENKVDLEVLRLIFPAEFRKGKNQDLIIKAFGKFIKETRDNKSQLILPGTGVLMVEYKNLARELGIGEQVIFPGFLSKSEVRELYESCNIGVISSNSETFGQSIVEPYVLGKCILTRNVGVAADIVMEGENGYFFENENDLFEILLYLNSNKKKIKLISDNNFSNRNKFAWRTVSKKYSNLLFKL